ncbi:MAG: carbon starvation protein A [Fuerstiella sp.]|nr:carbon starvation protein A [Fuerstiella sp.]
MLTLSIAIGSFAAFILAYHTYGRWLSAKIFQVNDSATVPSHELRDDVDFVPTQRQVLFGHHFTSIAGTGPIVGPAIAVFWGWLPALLWVVLGAIFVGAVHDFGALMVSLRNRGQTIGEVAGRLINPRARLLFLLILFFALTIVLAIFGLVIAIIFSLYPESVLSVWVAMPLAVAIGVYVHRNQKASLLVPSLVALGILYASVYLGVYYCPITLPVSVYISGSPIVTWTIVLMIYCFIASVLPVWLLLQPRDYINSHQLVVALTLLVAGLAVAGLTGKADLSQSTPAIVAKADIPADAPPIMPFLFITIACGACSGFHCVVSSGTTSKQIARESDAQFIGYGSMLMEGALAVLVILACCAGVGMGRFEKDVSGTLVPIVDSSGAKLVGEAAWRSRYSVEGGWGNFKLPQTVGAFVEGGANFVTSLGIPLELSMGIIAVLVACFAATTLDTATRLQRYVVQELGASFGIKPLTNKYGATLLAVVLGTLVAMIPNGAGEYGKGGLILWPLFGATNQLLAGLAFMVLIFFLARRGRSIKFAIIPVLMMTIIPAYALGWNMFRQGGWLNNEQPNYLLAGFGLVILALQAWMVAECVLLLPKVKGVLEEALPPLERTQTSEVKQVAQATGGPNC